MQIATGFQPLFFVLMRLAIVTAAKAEFSPLLNGTPEGGALIPTEAEAWSSSA